MKKSEQGAGRIVIASSQSNSNHSRGKLFEGLAALVLENYGYEIDRVPSTNYPGMEVDIEGRFALFDIPMYAECKYYDTKIDSPTLRGFFGAYMSRWLQDRKAHGIFIAIPGVNSHAKAFYNETCGENRDIHVAILDEADVIAAIQKSRNRLNIDAIQGLVSPAVGRFDRWELIFSDLGIFWVQFLCASGAAMPNAFFLVDDIGMPIRDTDAAKILADLKYDSNGLMYIDLTRSSVSANGVVPSAHRIIINDPNMDFINDFILSLTSRGYAPKSIKTYGHELSSVERATGKSLVQLTTAELEEMAKAEARKGLVASSIKKKINVLRAFYKYALMKNYIVMDPTLGMSAIREPSRKAAVQLSSAEINKIIGAFRFDKITDVRNAAMVSLFIHVGTKPNEVVALDVEDIDLSAKVITLGNREQGSEFPINEALETHLRRWLDVHPTRAGALFVGTTRSPGEWERLKYDGMRHAFNEIVRRAGLDPKRATFNSIRSAFGSKLLSNKNLAVDEIQTMLGYKSTQSLGRHTKTRGLKHLRGLID